MKMPASIFPQTPFTATRILESWVIAKLESRLVVKAVLLQATIWLKEVNRCLIFNKFFVYNQAIKVFISDHRGELT